MRIPKRYAGCVAATLLAVGICVVPLPAVCAAAAGIEVPAGKKPGQEGAPVTVGSVVFQNQKLADDIEIMEVKSTTGGELLQMQVTLRISARAKDPELLPFMYMFRWFDDEGKGVSGNQGVWQPHIIFGRGAVTIRGTAPDPRARQFRLMIQGPDGGHC